MASLFILQGNLIPFDLFATVAAELKQACIDQQRHEAKREPECVPRTSLEERILIISLRWLL